MNDRQVVVLGEASYGTHEYYIWRTAISKKLIEEKGFDFSFYNASFALDAFLPAIDRG